MTRKSKEKPSGFTREEAKLILDDVLKRHRIHPPGHAEGAQRIMLPLAAPKVKAEELLLEPVTSGPTAAKRPSATGMQSEFGPPLDFEWRQYLLDTPASANAPIAKEYASGSAGDGVFTDRPVPTEYHDFHYLIRVLECAFTLHCQVTAATAADARDQVGRIPNLIEWRETSLKELAEITKIQTKGRQIGREKLLVRLRQSEAEQAQDA